ncbi:MAG: hypothetical protein HQ542_00865, partial [Bacteroidia bacterium]|nr:hypothetical protein [Bacteroidia bacterium]
AKDSTTAMAWYELSRVKWYMLTGGGNVSMDEILESIDKATLYDSGNVIYAYAKAMDLFLSAYMAMHKGGDNVTDAVGKTCQEFEHVLVLKPDYSEAMLYLVEIYGLLPQEMGGDSAKAVGYVELLEQTDDFYAAKAKLVLNPGDEVAFWQDWLSTHDTTPEVLREIGIAYLYQEDIDQTKTYFKQAMLLDSTQNILLLDISRYYMFQVMQNRELADSLLPISAKFINKYLASEPTPVIPLQAYATGMLVKTEMFTGHKEEAEKLMEEAKALDPYFSRASGIPGASLFEPPDKISHHFTSFFRPF